MTQTDTRALAKEWIYTNIPGGSRIFIEGSRTRPSNGTVPLRNTVENLQASIDFYRGREPGKAKYFEMEIKASFGNTYDLVTVRPFELRDFQYYKDSDVQYVILRPNGYAGSRRKKHWVDFVMQMRNDPDVSMVQSFRPDPHSKPGPYIEIYRIDPVTGIH